MAGVVYRWRGGGSMGSKLLKINPQMDGSWKFLSDRKMVIFSHNTPIVQVAQFFPSAFFGLLLIYIKKANSFGDFKCVRHVSTTTHRVE